jgi:HlyD family secretion protein
MNDLAQNVDGLPARPANNSLSDRVRSLRLPNEHSSARSGGSRLPWVLCLFFAASTAVLGYFAYFGGFSLKNAEAAVEPNDPAAKLKSESASSTLTASTGEVVLESKGYVIPAHQILVSPKVSGLCEKLFFMEGTRVKKGDVLAQLETVDYQADYDHAVANLAASKQRSLELENGSRPEEIKQAEAELRESEAQRDQLLADWKRSSRLQSTKTVADREYEQIESQYKAMERRVERLRNAYALMVEGPRKERKDAARADVQQAEADVAKARWRLDNCTIRAPVTGTILKKSAEEGNLVNPVAFSGSTAFCEMADLSDLEVELMIQERDVSKVAVGQECKVYAEAFPKREYKGIVSRAMPVADRSKGAIPVRVKVTVPRDEEGAFLKPEMGAVVSFLKTSEKQGK